MRQTSIGASAAWLERLWHELAQPECFDDGVEAARNACVAGASLGAAVIGAGAYYDNPLTGAPALRACMQRLAALPLELDAWLSALAPAPCAEAGGALVSAGFGFVSPGQDGVFYSLLAGHVARERAASRCRFVLDQREALRLAGPLNAAGLCALSFLDHDVDVDTAERTFLLMKVDIALREALVARRAGVAAIPFAGVRYVYEGALPAPRRRDRLALMRRLGLEPEMHSMGSAPDRAAAATAAAPVAPGGGAA
jgi:hypothetical protein